MPKRIPQGCVIWNIGDTCGFCRGQLGNRLSVCWETAARGTVHFTPLLVTVSSLGLTTGRAGHSRGRLGRYATQELSRFASLEHGETGVEMATALSGCLSVERQIGGKLQQGIPRTALARLRGKSLLHNGSGPKTWSSEDMELALDSLRQHKMSLSEACTTYGIPATTLWQRAHRSGIHTSRKEGWNKSWSEEDMKSALEALRTGSMSVKKASKTYACSVGSRKCSWLVAGIPSGRLYKIAHEEGIRLAASFCTAPTAWTSDDLERALEAIRTDRTSVQRASTEFGIPLGTLYGRCRREGIELSRSNTTPWSEDAMAVALEAVRTGEMSVRLAAQMFNVPYSSLYGRFKRSKQEAEGQLRGDDASRFSPPGTPPPQPS